MRNHFSIIFEQLLKTLVGFVGFLFIMLFNTFQELDGNLDAEEFKWLLPITAALLLVIIIRTVLAVFAWAKTYITIDEETITVERDTLNKKKNTIGIQHISNVNLEQSLPQRLFGTMAVKIDTNTLSTANTNDIHIVLKREAATALKDNLLKQLEALHNPGAAVQPAAKAAPDKSSPILQAQGAAPLAVFLHGLFATRISSLLIGLLALGSAIWTLTAQLTAGPNASGGFLPRLVVLIFLFISSFSSMVKGFLKCYNFAARRQGNRLMLHYGLLKKVSYALPIDKINAVNIIQTPIARIFGRYTAEVVNIGMGDEEAAEQCTAILYCKKEQLLKQMDALLPEYAYLCDASIARQPRGIWLIWSVRTILTLLVSGGAIIATQSYHHLPLHLIIPVLLTVFIIHLLLNLLRYQTRGVAFREKEMILVWGCIGTVRTCVSYQKIQFFKLTQTPLSRACQIIHGHIHLLASSLNVSRHIPYFPASETARLPDCLLGRHS